MKAKTLGGAFLAVAVACGAIAGANYLTSSESQDTCRPDGDGGYNLVNREGHVTLRSPSGSSILTHADDAKWCYRGGDPDMGVRYTP